MLCAACVSYIARVLFCTQKRRLFAYLHGVDLSHVSPASSSSPVSNGSANSHSRLTNGTASSSSPLTNGFHHSNGSINGSCYNNGSACLGEIDSDHELLCSKTNSVPGSESGGFPCVNNGQASLTNGEPHISNGPSESPSLDTNGSEYNSDVMDVSPIKIIG